MKKAISLLLALVMCLSLCACGNSSDVDSNTVATNNSTTEPTTEFSTEPSTTTEPTTEFSTEPSTTEVDSTTSNIIEIELTTENWKEYFDTENVVLGYWWERNAFGEILQLLEVTFYYPLKEEYKNRIVNVENIEVVYEVVLDRGSVDSTINFQDEVVILNGAWVSNGNQLTMTERFSGSRIVEEGLRVGSIQTQGFVEPTEEPTSTVMEGSYFNNIARIQGTLYISE